MQDNTTGFTLNTTAVTVPAGKIFVAQFVHMEIDDTQSHSYIGYFGLYLSSGGPFAGFLLGDFIPVNANAGSGATLSNGDVLFVFGAGDRFTVKVSRSGPLGATNFKAAVSGLLLSA